MRLYRTIEEIQPLQDRPRAVAVGVFDGVHRGHREIIGRAVRAAKETGGRSCVLTFEPHPEAVVRPGRQPLALTSLRQKLELVEALGVDETAVVPFQEGFASTTADEFCRGLLVGRLGARTVVVGENFRFGAGAEGTAEELRRYGRLHGFRVEAIELLHDGAEAVSSTRVRRLLLDGDVETASRLLGRPHYLEGFVVAGAGRGRDLGVPTANLAVEGDIVIPAAGVYVTGATVEGGDHPSVTSVGTNPTFESDGAVRVEVHLLDFSAGLYGTWLGVRFLRRLRDQRRFESPEQLLAQMKADISSAAAFFSRTSQAGLLWPDVPSGRWRGGLW